jgi:hypothetical protein
MNKIKYKKLEVKKAKNYYYVDSDTHFITDNFNQYGESIDGLNALRVISHKYNDMLIELNKVNYHWEFEDYKHAKSICDSYNEELERQYK